jgi:hypothetical protein
MKKITFILFALIAGTTFAQNTSNATAPVKAEIVSPIGITLDAGTSMDFGKFTKSANGDATVILAPDGTPRTFSETDMEIVAYATGFDVPEFTVENNALYKVVLAVSTQPGSEMTLTDLTHNLGADGGNDETGFIVGGTLNVPSTATAGAQTGQVSVTVTYE